MDSLESKTKLGKKPSSTPKEGMSSETEIVSKEVQLPITNKGAAQQLYIVECRFKGVSMNAMLDTGANVSVIDASLVKKRNWKMRHKKVELLLASQETKAVNGILDKPGYITLGKTTLAVQPLVMKMENPDYKLIIGNVDMMRMGITLSNLPSPVSLRGDSEVVDSEMFSEASSVDTKQLHIISQELEELLNENKKIPLESWCTLENAVVKLKLTNQDVKVVRSATRNFVATAHEQAVSDTVKDWLSGGVISKYAGSTPVNLALLAVKQTDGGGKLKKIRVCLDLREINNLTTMDNIIIPTVHELAHKMAGKRIFTSFDLKSGYHQIKVQEEDRKYLAFTWKKQQYVFNAAPFGLNFLPSTFHRLISELFADLDDVEVYIDDILIASENQKRHDKTCREVVKRLNKAKLNINHEKSHKSVKEVLFLGFKISEKGVEIDVLKAQRLMNIKTPATGKDLQRFLGAMNFLRSHLPYYGEVVGPLYALSKSKKPLHREPLWQSEGLEAFEKAKALLHHPAILKSPLPNAKMYLETDASEVGFGGALFQLEPEDQTRKRYIKFFSGSFKKAQKSYSIPKKELFAIVYAFRHLKEHLYGRHFHLYTDNQALSRIHTMSLESRVIANWFDVLSYYSFDVTHTPREKNQLADHLSKMMEDTVKIGWNQSNSVNDLPRKRQRLAAETPDQVNTMTKFSSEQFEEALTSTLNHKETWDHTDWKLNDELFKVADKEFGPHTLDMFASKHNAQVPRFLTAQEDAFTFDLSKEKVWANPPWRLIPQLLDHVVKQKLTITIVVPVYTNAKWYNKFKTMVTKRPIIVPRCKNTFLHEGDKVIGKHPWDFTAVAVINKQGGFRWNDSFLPKWQNDFNREYKSNFGESVPNKADLKIVPEVANTLWREQAYGKYTLNTIRFVNKQPDKNTQYFNIGDKVSVNHRTKKKDKKGNTIFKWFPGIVCKRIPSNTGKMSYKVYFPDEVKINPDNPHGTIVHGKDIKPCPVEVQDKEKVTPAFAEILLEEELERLKYSEANSSAKTLELTEEKKRKIVEEYHNMTGLRSHSLARLLRTIGHYDWQNLQKLVEDVDKDCVSCELDTNRHKGFAPLKSIRPEFVGDIWTIDLMFVDQKPILHIVDNFSSFSMLRLLENKQDTTVVNSLLDVMYEHGFPRLILADNGSEFSQLYAAVVRNLAKIKIDGGSPYHPQTQGIAERKHGVIKKLLRHELAQFEGNKDWTQILPLIQLKLNIRYTARHNSTPFAVYYGRAPNALSSNSEKVSELTWYEKLGLMKQAINPKLYQEMSAYFLTQEKQFLQRNRKSIQVAIPEGTIVKVRRLGDVHAALDAKYEGPFQVTKKVHKGYNIAMVGHTKKINRNPIPPEYIEIYKAQRYTHKGLPPLPYPVDTVLNMRLKKQPGNVRQNRTEYLVQYVTDIVTEPEWVDGSRITDTSKILRYHQQNRAE